MKKLIFKLRIKLFIAITCLFNFIVLIYYYFCFSIWTNKILIAEFPGLSLEEIYRKKLAAFYWGKAQYADEREFWKWLTTRGGQEPMLRNLDGSLIYSNDIVSMGGKVVIVLEDDLCLNIRLLENKMQEFYSYRVFFPYFFSSLIFYFVSFLKGTNSRFSYGD